MVLKKIIIVFLVLLSSSLYSQDTEEKKNIEERASKLTVGIGMNIPLKPNNVSYDLGMSIDERYEYLLWEHWSVMQSLSYNFISGQSVQEYYEGRYVQVDYENFSTVPLQIGVGFYFGEGHKTFFILLKGGASWYKGVNPAYPEIIVNGNVVKEAIPRTEFNGVFGFFTPAIGWQFKRAQISASYQGSVMHDTKINVLNISLGFRIL